MASLGFVAKPRGEVRYRTDSCVVGPSFKSDPAQRGVALGDSDSKSKVMASPPPLVRHFRHAITHCDGHVDRPNSGVRAGNRIIEQDHEPITQKALECALEAMNDLANGRMVLAENLHHFFGLGGLGKGRE